MFRKCLICSLPNIILIYFVIKIKYSKSILLHRLFYNVNVDDGNI